MIILRQREFNLKSSFRHFKRDINNFKNNLSMSHKAGEIRDDLLKGPDSQAYKTGLTKYIDPISPSELNTLRTKGEWLSRYGKDSAEKNEGHLIRYGTKHIKHPENGADIIGIPDKGYGSCIKLIDRGIV